MLELQSYLMIVMMLMSIVLRSRRWRIGQWFQALQDAYKLIYRAVAIIVAITIIILKTSHVGPEGERESYFE